MSDGMIAAAPPQASVEVSRLDLDLRDADRLIDRDADWPSIPGCLRPAAEAAMIDWARRQPKDAALEILIRLPPAALTPAAAAQLADRVTAHFRRLAEEQDYTVRTFLADARISAAVGFSVFAACLLIVWTLYSGYQGSTTARALRDTLSILGWIAAWKPLEMLVHERRPLQRRLRLLRRLAAAPVRVTKALHP
jgi:hypothetical protein